MMGNIVIVPNKPIGRVRPWNRTRYPDSRQGPKFQFMWFLTQLFSPGLLAALIIAVLMLVFGMRFTSPSDSRLLAAARSVIPDADGFREKALQLRVINALQAVHVVAKALEPPLENGNLLKPARVFGLSESGVENARAHMLIELAGRLDRFPEQERLKILNRLLVAAELIGTPKWLVYVDELGKLSEAQRDALILDNGATLRLWAEMIPRVEQAEFDRRSVMMQLAAREDTIRKGIAALLLMFSRDDPALIACLSAALNKTEPGTNEFHRCLRNFLVPADSPSKRRQP
jgi:hypothetical protein